MPISEAVRIERLVKRVDNAIHNPAMDYKTVREALDDLKCVIHPSREDYDHWIHLAIEARSDKKICSLFCSRISEIALSILFKYSPHNIPLYVNSKLFNPNLKYPLTTIYVYDDILCYQFAGEGAAARLPYIHLFFKQPKTASIIIRLTEKKLLRKNEQILYMNANPLLRKRKQQRKILLRFWLTTVKNNLLHWKESLYFPGTGALYKKAEASFLQESKSRL
jgi:hypothetical protein